MSRNDYVFEMSFLEVRVFFCQYFREIRGKNIFSLGIVILIQRLGFILGFEVLVWGSLELNF